ncbi:MAG TPA: ATP-binding protein [Spirochaetota bacterium]|nr:ATP-binding protein [Spirochaetota bacterium]HPC41184.1 ATP-binding protein [Spirochaetota bacterium]HPL17125.1 ATP-binding protein [Spirochaetota bacterium]HRS78545.1 ATP-binding protein [Spirochaetota bacterium]HRT77251.1 ATP-binding protein [Spirochaetota bacterium]
MDYDKQPKETLIDIIHAMESELTDARQISERLGLYSSIVEQAAESIAVMDLNGNYIFFNKSYEKLRGCTREELFGKKFKDVYSTEERKKREQAFEEVMARGYWKGELLFQRKDGSYVPTSCTTVLMKNRAGHPMATIGLMTDITELKNAEMRMKEARDEAERANRLKSYFLATMSHEIRTPINAMLGFTEMLIDEEDSPEKKARLELVYQSGKMLLDLVNDILDLSKIEAGKYEIVTAPFSLGETISAVRALFESAALEKGIDFTVAVSDSLPAMVMGDQKRMRQVILNMTSNAFKFTEKGSVGIRCDYRDGTATIRVEDTGIGIGKEHQEAIFSEFSQADETIAGRYGGTGLGLAICRKLLSLMNGSITVESEPGRGSVFTVTIPLPPAEDAGKALSETTAADGTAGSGFDPDAIIRDHLSSGRPLRILVSEDDSINRKFIDALLRKIGLACDLAVDGGETLEKMRRTRYDVVFLDMQMPVMNGEEVLAALKHEGLLAGPHIIAQTAYAMVEDEAKFISMGCKSYLAKPIDRHKLKAKIAEAITCKPPPPP